MKKFLLFLISLLPFLGIGQTTLQTVDFETAVGYTTSVTEYLTNDGSYYTRLNYATNSSSISTPAPYSNYQGSWIFVMEDTGGSSETQTMTLTSVNISGYTSLKVKVLVAGQNNTAGTLETNKHMSFYANIDGGGDVLIGSFRGNGSSSYLYKDDDLSGSIGGGETTVLTAAFTEYTFNISGTGSNMVISTKCLLSTLNEEGAYDNIRVLGTLAGSSPTITTQAVSSISTTTATGNGTITATGGANVTERGIYWSTTSGFANGTGTKVATTGDWNSTGAFTQAITGLSFGTLYYLKAFATNSSGTGYGTEVSFTTKTPGLWTGATSTDWHTTSNWDDGVVPTATVDVTIPNVSNKPVIGSAAVCKALTVQSSSSLTIQSGQTLNVKGNMTLQNSSTFSNSGTLQFSGADCHLTDNRSSKTNLGNITVTD